jgi:hypothetical protein
MATYSTAIGFNKGQASFSSFGGQRFAFTEVELDLPSIVAARSAGSAAALAANDIIQVIPVPAGSLVLNVGVDVTTVEGETATINVGDGDIVDGYHSGLNINAVGHAISTGKFYSAADTIDVQFLTATPTTAVMRVWALMLNTNKYTG